MKNIEVIAEIANSHEGKIDVLFKLLKELKNNDVKIVKFQIFHADELVSIKHKKFFHFKKISFNDDQWKRILNYANSNFDKVYADIFGEKSYKIAKRGKIDGYKIHSSDILNNKLIQLIKKKDNKKYFLSAGGCNPLEIKNFLKKINKKVILLHGFQAYPTKPENINLRRIALFKKLFKDRCEYGYQDHSPFNSNYGFVLSALSISLGCNYIEKHVTLSRKIYKIDHHTSLEPSEIKIFLEKINNLKNIFGKDFEMSQEEINYRDTTRKKPIIVKKAKIHSKLILNNLNYVRNDTDNTFPIDSEILKGKTLINNINANSVLKLSYFKSTINALLIARNSSRRLPKKSLLKVNNKTTLEYLIDRAKNIKKVNKVILCTSSDESDNELVKIAKQKQINYFRGSYVNVLKRILDCCKKYRCDHILRITGDDIFIDHCVADEMIDEHISKNSDYTYTEIIPKGTEVEVFSVKALKILYKYSRDSTETEYLTKYIFDNPGVFKIINYKNYEKNLANKYSLTLDTKNDFKNIKKAIHYLTSKNKIENYKSEDLVKFINLKIKKQKKINKKNILNKNSTDLIWNI